MLSTTNYSADPEKVHDLSLQPSSPDTGQFVRPGGME